MATTRQAHTVWEGNLIEGKGVVTFDSSGIGEYDVSWPSRSEAANGKTSPEELIAAAHSACYAMQLSNEIAEAGGTPHSLDVKADVTLGADPAGGVRITGIHLTVRGEVEGLDEAGFLDCAERAKASCPLSKALTGTDITLDAALD